MYGELVRAVNSGFLLLLRRTLPKARRRHDTWPVASAAGKVSDSRAALGANLKGDDLLTRECSETGRWGDCCYSHCKGG